MGILTVVRPYLKSLLTGGALLLVVFYVISGRQMAFYFTPGVARDLHQHNDPRPGNDTLTMSTPVSMSLLLPTLGASLPPWHFRSPQPAIFQNPRPHTPSTTASGGSPGGFSHTNPEGFSHTNPEDIVLISKDSSMVSQLHDMEQRPMHLNTTCFKDVLLNATYKRTERGRFFHSKVYNIAYCKVPKVGSTFWTLLFTTLDNGVDFGKKLLEKKRSSLHNGRYTFSSSFTYVKSAKVATILPTRDPYSRLFSAFIDKSYLPIRINTNYAVLSIQNKSLCATDVSFQEFLNWILNEAKVGKSLDQHWAPIYSICGSCEVNAQYIVKQETFTNDIGVILQKLNVSSEKYNFIMHTLEGKRIQSSLPGIVATILDRSSAPEINRCMPWLEVTRRIWRSFQIQGFIREDRGYPQDTFESIRNSSDPSLVSDIILAEIFKYTLSSEERKIQRENALRKAYEGVSKDVVDVIKDLYSVDFSIYGYSNIPPNER
ncbi:uncharacterized protein LOC127858856 [Dreissena polymorpha]|uniref:uncharacterized protein LOC127858856 n=1 Tax=Dreissena polymorpha TaxID=45954 RepID=UPI00226401E7|nr:uncharacterized protein LOC127858856 [Dreissena polymorpha]